MPLWPANCVILKMDQHICSSINHWTTSLILIVVLLPFGCNSDDIVDNAEDVVGIIEDVCPEGRAVLGANRTLSVNPSYDGGNLKHWFTMARGLVNSVKEENLPYGMSISSVVYQ